MLLHVNAPETHVLTETQEEVKRGLDGVERERGSITFAFWAFRL